ncbi:MAG TPA: hypothetical protein VEG38_20235 [Acidimicrobiia bacterium]|nr:hypothetical protein [Acidimicrobiia bacterium]
MTASLAPRRHDTATPLTCCSRCHKAEILGRRQRRPIFRHDRIDVDGGPSTYTVHHGDQQIATLRRKGASGSTYEVSVISDGTDQQLLATTLRGARALAEETYTASWREGGAHTDRGPVREI